MKNINISKISQRKRGDVQAELTWDTQSLYKNFSEWEKDKNKLNRELNEIVKNKNGWTSTSKKMFEMLELIDKLSKNISKLYLYVSLFYDTDMGNSKYSKMEGEVKSLSVNFQSIISFIDSDIVNIKKSVVTAYFKKEPRLKVYKRKIDLLLKLKKHVLSQEEEHLVSMTGLFSENAEKASSILSNAEIPNPEIKLSNGQKITLDIASYIQNRGSENKLDRQIVMKAFWEKHQKFENTFATLLDSEVQKHLFYAKTYNFKNNLDAVLTPKDINEDVYLNLIKTVKKNLSPLHRYIKLKKNMLGLKKIEYNDIYASSVIDSGKEYSIERAKEMLVESLGVLGDDYIENLKKGLNGRWMDVYPNKNKRSGAYSNGSAYDTHPFVMMNFGAKYNDVSTLTHEFGHAMHSFYSNQTQPHATSRYPIFLAEIASTFNETLLVDYVLENEEDEKSRLYIIDKHLEGLRGTIYRQVLFAEFELLMHQYVESGNSLTAEWLNENYLKLTKEYYGHDKGVIFVDDYFKSEWSWIPHFYYNFYVYQYATGIVAAMSLVDLVKEGGEKARNKYLDFLKSGNSKTPLKTLKLAGVDLTKSEPIEKALAKFDSLVDEMEQIYKRIK